MPLLLDLILVLVFALCVYTGLKRGFIRSVMGIAVVVISLIGALKLSPFLSSYLNRTVVGPGITEQVSDSIDSIMTGTIDLDRLFEEKPTAFTDILDSFGIDFEELHGYYRNELKAEGDASAKLSAYIADPIAKMISDAAAFAVLFILFSLVLTVIMLVISLIVRIPLLNELNKGLGLVLGILKGGLYAWGLSLIFCNLLPHLAVVYQGKIPATIIDQTVLVKLLGAVNLTSLF